MIDLLPCPFCGATGDIYADKRRMWGLIEHREGCLFPSKPKHEIPEYDIAAWNTRAERTCHAELNEGRNAVVCSECGSSMLLEGWEEMKDWGGNTLVNTFKTYPYCPNCGSKVVEQ